MLRIIIVLLCMPLFTIAQVGIGTSQPEPSAQLEVKSTNKGFLPPRVALTSITDNTTISMPVAGLLVYCTGTAGLTAGYHYWSGAAWVRVALSNEVVNSIGTISNTSNSKGATIASGALSLTPADATNGGIITTGAQTIAGSKTFSSNINVNDLNIGMPATGSQNTMLGNASFGYSSPGNNNTGLGFFTLSTLTNGEDNTAVGTNAIRQGPQAGAATGSRNTAVGSAALTNGGSSSNNVAVGVNTLSNATGGDNTAVGTYALQSNTTARENVAIGIYSLHHATSGGYNTAVGTSSMYLNTIGDVNTALGHKSLYSNINGRYNTAVGVQSQESNTSGSNNTAIGVAAIDQNTTGNNNAVLGAFAGRHFGTNPSFLVDKNTVMNNSVLIGSDARPLANNSNNEIVIGYNAVGKGPNTVQLGNSAISSVNTSGTIKAGAVTYPNTDGTNGQVLTTNGSGTASWTTPSGATTNSLTFNNSGSGDASGTTFNGAAAKTISYNSIGASPLAGSSSLTTLGTITTGTWSATTIAVANGGTGATTAVGARTNLGATTVGSNFFTLNNPSAIAFPRINADNTISTLDATAFRSAIGAGTSSTNGTVISVGLSLPNIFSVTGSPITTAGTITGTLANQNINTFFAGPSSGSAAAPTFRSLVAADIPSGSNNYIQNQTSADQSAGFRINGNGLFGEKIGIGTVNPLNLLHIENSNTAYTSPDNNNIPAAYIFNTNNSSSTAHAMLAVRTGGSSGGDPFFSWDVNGEAGWSMGIDNSDGNKLKIASVWDDISSNTRITLDRDGDLGIGTTNPGVPLEISTSGDIGLRINSTSSDNNGIITLNANTNSNFSSDWHEFMSFQKQGVTIGRVSSNGPSNVSFVTNSDSRLKKDLRDFDATEIINKMRVYDYAWKSDNSRMFGFIAHELQAVVPYLVTGEKDAVDAEGKPKYQMVDYGKLTPVLAKAIQEQQAVITAQEQRIIELEKQVQQILEKLK